ncbi:MAG: HEAT repeat domain-containing protein [Ignavibacteria bacterium]
MNIHILLLSFILFSFSQSPAQQSIDSILNFTLSYRGMTRSDVTIPINFDKDKSPRNDSKLLLPVVQRLMMDPLQSSGWMDSLSELSNRELDHLLIKTFFDFTSLSMEYNNSMHIPFYEKNILSYSEAGVIQTPVKLNQVALSIIENLKLVKQNDAKLFKVFSEEEISFLRKNLLSIFAGSESEEGNNSDIFKFNHERDSSISISKRTLDILNKVNRNSVFINSWKDFVFANEVFHWFVNFNKAHKNYNFEYIKNENIDGEFLNYYDEDGIRIAIGGKGKNIYTGHFDFIIDLGGDDVYNIDNESKDIFKNNFSCIIDLSGNDYYSTNSNYSLAGSVFSSGFIFDKEGDDIYKGKNVSLGSAICGLGILYDENGNDTYQANQFSIGAASFGVGLLVDRNGNDVYLANSYSQGFGMTEGVGAIVDNKGNDNYLIDARSLDIGRYEDHYVSMSQGYGLGLRPYYAGGVGLIIEGEGNDFYSTDIFGQGGAYWYALGCIVDKSGHDKYNSYQYAQGAGIHLAVGLLKDYDGWDFYTSDGVSQGCGHDFGFGLLYDVKGNDNYSAYSLSQGAGNANGIGMLIDESGRDGYLNKEPGNTKGYGNSRREFGSIGVFLDASGEDFYSVGGLDSTINNTSMWGVMDDFYLKDLPAQASGNTFKIPLDSNKDYTQDEYFIMAKTIEPRFSLWQEYGFRKLVEDSLRTPEYILKYLDTDDHRAALVLRNLAFRISYTMGNFLTEKLREYNRSMRAKPVFNPNQVAFICYLFGETQNPIGKEELLQLTHDENIRIRSAAVNALGKIKIIDTNDAPFLTADHTESSIPIIDHTDAPFITDVSQRLRELASENSTYKLYSKDIAYAFKNYKNFNNIATLIKMMSHDYFGVRFLAAEDLRSYDTEYYGLINSELLKEISEDRIWYQSFLNSITNFSEDRFMLLFDELLKLEISNDEIIILNYIDLLKYKFQDTNEPGFKAWSESLIRNLQSKSILKTK